VSGPLDGPERFAEDGYLIGHGLVPNQLLDMFVGDFGETVHRSLAHYGLQTRDSRSLDALYQNLATLHQFSQTLYLAALRVTAKLKSLYDLFLSQSVAHACRDLGIVLPMLHTHPLLHVLSDRLRIDEGYHGFEAHQDWSGLQSSLNTIVVWLPFHDVDEHRFPLEVVPSSHLNGVSSRDLATATFVPLHLKKGDVVFLSAFTIHRTGMTGSGGLRIAASWRYEDAAEPSFIARRYPLAQTRVVNHDLMIPGFPDAEEMRRHLKRFPV
jgi:Phytanoyl-CoA dioxygenase (PhyH)